MKLTSQLGTQYVSIVVLITLQGVLVTPFQLWLVRNEVVWRAAAILCTINIATVLVASYFLFKWPVWIIKLTLAIVFVAFGLYKVFDELKIRFLDQLIVDKLHFMESGPFSFLVLHIHSVFSLHNKLRL